MPALLSIEQAGVAGEWDGTYSGTGGERLGFTLTLKQGGEYVTGTYYNPQSGPTRGVANLSVFGSFVNGVLWLQGGPRGFKATVAGNTMNGTFLAAVGSPLTFTAQRTK